MEKQGIWVITLKHNKDKVFYPLRLGYDEDLCYFLGNLNTNIFSIRDIYISTNSKMKKTSDDLSQFLKTKKKIEKGI